MHIYVCVYVFVCMFVYKIVLLWLRNVNCISTLVNRFFNAKLNTAAFCLHHVQHLGSTPNTRQTNQIHAQTLSQSTCMSLAVKLIDTNGTSAPCAHCNIDDSTDGATNHRDSIYPWVTVSGAQNMPASC